MVSLALRRCLVDCEVPPDDGKRSRKSSQLQIPYPSLSLEGRTDQLFGSLSFSTRAHEVLVHESNVNEAYDRHSEQHWKKCS